MRLGVDLDGADLFVKAGTVGVIVDVYDPPFSNVVEVEFEGGFVAAVGRAKLDEVADGEV